MSPCHNIRCTAPVRFRLVPYGQKHKQTHSCVQHFARTANELLATAGGPILVYSTSEAA